MARAQVALEFMLMIGLAMVLVVGLANVLYIMSSDYSEERNINMIQDLGYSLQNEIILAAEVEPGYSRQFIVPDAVGDANFSINITERDLVINYKGTDFLFPIPQELGSISKGNNVITKCDSANITINEACPS